MKTEIILAIGLTLVIIVLVIGLALHIKRNALEIANSVKIYALRPNDILVITFKGQILDDITSERIRAQCQKIFEHNRVVIMHETAEISVVQKFQGRLTFDKKTGMVRDSVGSVVLESVEEANLI